MIRSNQGFDKHKHVLNVGTKKWTKQDTFNHSVEEVLKFKHLEDGNVIVDLGPVPLSNTLRDPNYISTFLK